MKLLRIKALGLPLFPKPLDLIFYAQRRVCEEDKEVLFPLSQNLYLHTANVFTGINASGKTSVLKVIQLALSIVKNEPINHVEARTILGDAKNAVFQIDFLDEAQQVCRLRTAITSEKIKGQGIRYTITDETFWEKPLFQVKTKITLTEFSGIAPSAVRQNDEMFLPDDVSILIAHNKKLGSQLPVYSLLSFTNVNVLPVLDEIPLEVIAFLDPTIEQLYFEKGDTKTTIHLKFRDSEEILLNQAADLEQYLSSGTIKGIITFSMAREALQTGGYLLMDEIENHFNQEIVKTLLRFFMDASLNRKGGVLIFTTHYPEILDEYERTDGIYIVRNRNGIEARNMSEILKRNDIKKSEAYQSGFLEGTTPVYESYLRLKKSLKQSIR